jgi:hypothetical protein
MGYWYNFGSGDGTLNLYNYGAATRYLTITTTGAATFSSSVTATNLILNGTATTALDLTSGTFSYALDFQNNDFIRQKNVAGTLGLVFGMSTDDNLYVRGYSGINLQVNNGTTALGLASTGAATFSSTVATNGIIFPGTQVPSADANTLDDYEEGTWTMGISFGGASVGVTYGGSTGTYTKIGRQVTVNGYLLLSNKGSSTGTAKITGLPFTTLNKAISSFNLRTLA